MENALQELALSPAFLPPRGLDSKRGHVRIFGNKCCNRTKGAWDGRLTEPGRQARPRHPCCPALAGLCPHGIILALEFSWAWVPQGTSYHMIYLEQHEP